MDLKLGAAHFAAKVGAARKSKKTIAFGRIDVVDINIVGNDQVAVTKARALVCIVV